MRQDLLANVKRVVIKIGSRVLTGEDSGLDETIMGSIAAQVAHLRQGGREVIIVSSGAIAAGRKELGLEERPRTIPQKQATAAVGQTRLMHAYENAFAPHGFKVGQLLLTREDLADRHRFLNARATIDTLLGYGVIPVINENDTVVVDEIKFGDNDNLSALVTNLVDAHLLMILTDIDGYFSADPRTDPDARLIPLVKKITKEVEQAACGSGSSVGTGGMATKVAAARRAGQYGVPTFMLNGKSPELIARAFAGDEVGTLFLPAVRSLTSRKHWIAHTLRPTGRIIVDAGAKAAISNQGRSLLPSGVIQVEGAFNRGACVRVCGVDNMEFARGIVDYSHAEIRAIHGRRSSEIEEILGYRYGDEIIHRDNLVVVAG
jgi:glutamate 5-kinase